MQISRRPRGVTLLAVADIILGVVFLLLAALMAEPCSIPGECHLTPLVNFLAIVPAMAGLVALTVGYGLWSKSTWGWIAGVGLGYLGAVLTLSGFALLAAVWGMNFVIPEILLLVLMVADLYGISYLRKPLIKAYFSKS